MPGERLAFLTDSHVLESMQEGTFAWLLEFAFPRERLLEFAGASRAAPRGGVLFRNMETAELADFVASVAYEDPKFLKRICADLRGTLPDPLFPGHALTPAKVETVFRLLSEMAPKAALALAVRLLGDPNPKVRQKVESLPEALERADEEWQRREGEAEAPEPEAPAAEGDAAPESQAVEAARSRIEGLEREAARDREELERTRRELDEARRKLGDSNEQVRALTEEVRKEREGRRDADRRAAEHKREKMEALAPTEREAKAKEELGEARREMEILRQKVEFLEEQVALSTQEEEEAAEAPTVVDEEGDLARRVSAFVARRGRRPAVLVIGGAGKQYAQRRKFEEFKARVGFEGEWEWADYDGWHRRMERLRNDMDRRYDGLIVLHWNRTTFVERAREIADRAGRPHRIIQYRGFLSLRRALLDVVGRIAGEAAAAPAS